MAIWLFLVIVLACAVFVLAYRIGSHSKRGPIQVKLSNTGSTAGLRKSLINRVTKGGEEGGTSGLLVFNGLRVLIELDVTQSVEKKRLKRLIKEHGGKVGEKWRDREREALL